MITGCAQLCGAKTQLLWAYALIKRWVRQTSERRLEGEHWSGADPKSKHWNGGLA
jgi:hypothetical protein